MKYDDTVVLIYAKAPVAGQVNTRLIPDIGEKAATKLQRDLLYQRVSMLSHLNLCEVILMCAPDVHHEDFVKCKKNNSIKTIQQIGVDLGERLLNGVSHSLKNFKYCIVVGTDAPSLDEEKFTQAIDVLHKKEQVVFVPAEDGGYVLLALNKAHAFLFRDISWGTAAVMQQSRDKLNEKGLEFIELEACWDIDRLADYQRYLKLTRTKG